MWRSIAGVMLAAFGLLGAVPPAHAERVRLESATPGGATRATVMKPFDVYLVAERDSAHPKVSAVGYQLQVPDGIVVVGEELLVETLLGLGHSRSGMNLVIRCTDQPRLRIVRYRFVATRPVANAAIALHAEPRMRFLGLIACQEENFAKFESAPDSILVTAR